MKCARCEMLNQTPEAPCSHCGRMMPALKPVFIAKEDEDAGPTETPQTDAPPETEQAEASQEAEATPEEEVDPQDGHVDNVGDESETETVT